MFQLFFCVLVLRYEKLLSSKIMVLLLLFIVIDTMGARQIVCQKPTNSRNRNQKIVEPHSENGQISIVAKCLKKIIFMILN